MANNTRLNAGTGGDQIATEDIGGVKYELVKLIDATVGSTVPIGTAANPLRLDPTGSTAQPISGTITAITNPVAVTGTFWQATQPVSTDSLPLPSGASTAAAQTTGNTSLSSIDGKITACNTGAVVLAAGSAAVGTVIDGGSAKTIKSAVVSLAVTGTVIPAVASKRIKVFAIKLICSAALSVNWRDGAATALEGVQSIAINGGYTESVNPPNFLFATTAGNSLDLVISGVGTAAGRVSYFDDDAT